jgi:hypothetical protein
VILTHDAEMALAAVAALVNTIRGGTEQLPDTATLHNFAMVLNWTGERTPDQADLEAVRRLRTWLAQLWEMNLDAAAHLLNALLREANALPQLVKHDGWDYHLHIIPLDSMLADRIAVDQGLGIVA